jgi:subtilisin family serine protease
LKRVSGFLLLLAYVLFDAAPAHAQERSLDPTIRQLLRPQTRDLIRNTPALGLDVPAAQQPFGGTLALDRPAGQDARVGVIVRLASPGALAELRAAGAEVGVVVGDIATAWVPLAALERVASLTSLQRVEAARALTTVHDSSMIAIRADGLRHLAGDRWTGATGEGVLVGIYDTGLDLFHEDFRDANGRTRVVALWDQTNVVRSPPPGFTNGFFCTQQAIQLRLDTNNANSCPQNDFQGHGTHVAGTAAGDGSAPGSGASQYRFAGVAPAADIMIVKGGPGIFFENLVVEGLVFIRRLALERGQPAVVNLSLGGQFGPHDGSRLYEQVIDELSGPGFLVVISAGNQGSNRNTDPETPQRLIHARGVPVGTQTVEFTVELCLNSADPGCAPYTPSGNTCAGNAVELDFWYEAQDRLTIEIVRPNGSSLAVRRGETNETNDPTGHILIDNGSQGPNPENGDIEAILMIDGCGAAGPPQSGAWRIRVTPEVAGSGQPYDMWIYRSTVGIDGISRGGAGFDNRFLVTSPGNATSAITVGAFVTKVCWPSQSQAGQNCYTQREQIGDIARFSNAGPRRDGARKPEIAAPGIAIASSRASDFNVPANRLHPDGVHSILEGTSMSAPHVTGAVAVLLQASPSLSPPSVKSLLQLTATQDVFTGRTYGTLGGDAAPADWWGYGKLNVRDALFGISDTEPAVLAISAVPVAPDSAVHGRLGARLPLLSLVFESKGDEQINVIRLEFDLTGRDPFARLLIIRDVDGDGDPDATEPVLGSIDAPLPGGTTRVQLSPDSLRVPAAGTTTVLVVLQLSGQAPHGSSFQAELVASATVSIGLRSLAQNPLEIENVVGSGVAATSVLRSDQSVSLSENPVRGGSVRFVFAQSPTTAAIYTIAGRRVVDLRPQLGDGIAMEWDLTNASGDAIVPGVYLVVFTVDGRTFREKLIVLTPRGALPRNPE